MISTIHTNRLSASIEGKIRFDQAAPSVLRVLVPIYHEDGDMYDIFLQETNGKLILCDFGMTLTRLSYRADTDTEEATRRFAKIAANNGVTFDRGNLWMETSYENFFIDLMQYAVAVSKVSKLEPMDDAFSN